MATNSIATAADYADAMLTARRAKNWLFSLLLLMLLAQVGLFIVARYYPHRVPGLTSTLAPTAEPTPAPTTEPAIVAPAAPADAPESRLIDLLHYLVGATGFLGMIFSILLCIVLLLIVNIMLVGRLIGISRVTSAFLWCLLLTLLLFPWQAFLNNANLTAQEFKIPGVLYTWNELVRSARFPGGWSREAGLKWGRFVVFPALAILILLLALLKSRRGLQMALGEAQPSPPLQGSAPV